MCFLFIAQPHQLLHALGVAMELSRDPSFSVDVLAPTGEHIALARELAARHGSGPIGFGQVGGPLLKMLRWMCGKSIPPKVATLLAALPRLAGYDAIVVPERTSLMLRRFGLRRTSFIHTCHGAGDRAVGLDERIRLFDLVLIAGNKQLRRMSEAGLIHEGGYAVVGYGKFDLASPAPAESLFATRRPIVLYNPHCSPSLSSWWSMGESIVRQFAADPRYNLIVAPHIKLFDGRGKHRALLDGIASRAAAPNIIFDPGSRRSIDLTYTNAADIYVGDVSSQVYEFIARPRPCLFLNAGHVRWRDDENFRHWHYGPVLDSTAGLVDAIDAARESHRHYRDAQFAGLRDTFDTTRDRPAARAARAIRQYLARKQGATSATHLPADSALLDHR